jgi:hypothetical protein
VGVTKTCAACGRQGTRSFVVSGYYANTLIDPIDTKPGELIVTAVEYVCQSGPACDRRCRKLGFSIYG